MQGNQAMSMINAHIETRPKPRRLWRIYLWLAVIAATGLALPNLCNAESFCRGNPTVTISAGSSGTYAPRAMTYAGSHLQYNLYTAAQLVTIWGDGSGGTQTVAQQITDACQYQFFNIGFNCSGSQSNTVYAAVPAMQNVVAGVCADNIIVTVTFLTFSWP